MGGPLTIAQAPFGPSAILGVQEGMAVWPGSGFEL